MAKIHWMNIVFLAALGACTKSKFKGDQDPNDQPKPVVNDNPETPKNPPQDVVPITETPPNAVTSGNQQGQPAINNTNAAANQVLGQLAEEIIRLTGNGPNNVPGGGGETPLVLDWNRDGMVSTSSAGKSNKVLFDIDGDGTLDFIEWVHSADALLVVDSNQNGRIDSGRELFGTAMPKRIDSIARSSNGFVALADYDENGDQVIDRRDPIYGRLMLWFDSNQNAVSEPSELIELKSTDVASVSLTYRNLVGAERNLEAPSRSSVGQIGSYRTSGGNQYQVFDLYFHVVAYGRQTSLTMLNGVK